MGSEVLLDRFIFDDPSYASLAQVNRERYLAGDPFPHIYFDNFLPDDVAQAVLEEFPQKKTENWIQLDRRAEIKMMCSDEKLMGPVTRQLIYQFNSLPFLKFISTLTGIPNLMPDPLLAGGGLHMIRRGGLLKLHADFNRHNESGLDRRVNILFYLNPDWKEEYGGMLELWDKDCKHCGDKILPIFNRLAIFSTTSHSFHGHPDPLTCPDDMVRKSLAMYYYSNGRPEEEMHTDHTTIFKSRPGEVTGGIPLHLVQDLMPPMLWRQIRKFREKRLAKLDGKIGTPPELD